MLNDRLRLALEAAGILKPAAPGGARGTTKTRLKARPTIVNGKWKDQSNV